MYTHLLDFIEQNKIIYKHQYGFRQKHAIITLVDRITNSLDKGDIVISIFLYLKKAFDMVDHPTLLNKLYAYGIRGNAFNWFESYLSERSQYVVYDSKQSKTQTVQCGVPQGSILGPLLFIIYMNDICNASELLFSILYADDTSVQISGNDITYLVSSMNAELELLSYSSRGVVASAPDFERADEGSILTAGLCFKSGKSECNNSGYKLTGLTWWP